ncbi:MAG: Mur ligase family protein [Chloroflexota bacterium]|nr:Mur ligase family protein [Chloroflexota bacterium]
MTFPLFSTPADSTPAVLARYQAAVARVDALIERSQTPTGKTTAEIRGRAIERLVRARRFLALLGNPEGRYPIVHVGGTSGKGSTSTAIAAILTAAGYTTGLHTSPYLQAASEKLQIDGKLIAPDRFADLVDHVLAAHDRWLAAGHPALTYGEIWLALLTTFFAEERVDVAVIEVGAGGRFDLTNVVSPVVSVITSVNLDHTVTLGETIAEIAWHKAGIIKAGVPAVTAVTGATALGIIEAEASSVGTSVTRVIPGETFAPLPSPPGEHRNQWRDLAPPGEGRMYPAPPGLYQVTNAATAVAAVRALPPAFAFDDAAISAGLGRAAIPGRYEMMPGAPAVILDGAHNPEKVAALVENLRADALSDLGRHLVVVLGIVEAKQHAAMIGRIVPHASALIVTVPRVLAKPGAEAAALARAAREAGFDGPLRIEPDPRRALDIAIDLAGDLASGTPLATVLVTGSLYLVGNVRDRWYSTDAIISQRTPWPDGADRAG